MRPAPPRAETIPLPAEDLAGVHLAPLVSRGVVPSLAWAVVQGRDVAAGGSGGAGERTVFQIGSVTKVFTALLLADMAERGEVRLSDPAAAHLPGAPASPPGAPGPVTLADLATHTSGLPRLPPGLFRSALLSPQDPYARYPERRFLRAARRALRSGRGPYVYSNFGYGLLGYLLGQAAGTAYQTLVTTRICGPLGLADTTFEAPASRKAQGYRRGRPAPDWHLGALAAAGALYSTAADLARLLQACLAAAPASPADPASPAAARANPTDPASPADPVSPATPLAAAIRATLTPGRPIPGGEISLAWHHTRRGDHTVIWHNGMTGGFSAMVAFAPVRGLAIAALANTASRPPSPLDEAVLRALS